MPTAPIYMGRYSPQAVDPNEQDATIGDEGFEFYSHRRIWIDYKRGGAVMWAPSYYPVWSARVHAVLALPDVPARLVFARANGISYVADRCVPGVVAVAQMRSICIYKGTG